MSIENNPLKLKLFVLDPREKVPDFSEALCAQENMDPDSWFVDDAATARVAKSYCRLCPHGPLKDDSCYEWAIKVEEQLGYFAYGIFGGRDAAHRQQILDAKRIRKNEGIEEPEDGEW